MKEHPDPRARKVSKASRESRVLRAWTVRPDRKDPRASREALDPRRLWPDPSPGGRITRRSVNNAVGDT